MFLLTLEVVLNRTGFNEDELRDLISKEIFPREYTLKPDESWDIDDVEKWCIIYSVKPKMRETV